MNPSRIRLPLLIGAPAYDDNRSLSRNGTPANGPSLGGASRRREGVVIQPMDDRVEPRVECVDPRDGGDDELTRGDVAAPHQLGEPESVVLIVLRERARAAWCSGGHGNSG